MTQYTMTPKPMHTTTFCLHDPKTPHLRRPHSALNKTQIQSSTLPVFYSSRLSAYGTLIHPQTLGSSTDFCCYTLPVTESHNLVSNIEFCSSPESLDGAVCHSKPLINASSKDIANMEPAYDTRTANRNINLTDPLMTDIVSESEKPLRSCDDPATLYDLASSPVRSQFYTVPGAQTHPDPGSPLSVESEWLSNLDMSLSCSSPSSASEVSPQAMHKSYQPTSVIPQGSKPKFFRSSRPWKSNGRCSNSVRLGVAHPSPGNNTQASRLLATKNWRYLLQRESRLPPSHSDHFTHPASRRRSLWFFPSEHNPSTISVLNRSIPTNDMRSVDVDASPDLHGFKLSPGSHPKRLLVHPTTGVSSYCYPSGHPTELAHSSKRLHLLDFILRLLDERNDTASLSRAWGHAPETNHTTSDACVEWIDEEAGVFAIKNPVRLAQLWGTYKNNRNMTFESLCRSLRLYYVSGKLERVRGQRNQYRLLDEPLH